MDYMDQFQILFKCCISSGMSSLTFHLQVWLFLLGCLGSLEMVWGPVLPGPVLPFYPLSWSSVPFFYLYFFFLSLSSFLFVFGCSKVMALLLSSSLTICVCSTVVIVGMVTATSIWYEFLIIIFFPNPYFLLSLLFPLMLYVSAK